MKPAADATVIDTTGLGLDVVVARIEHEIRTTLAAGVDPDRAADLPTGDGCEFTEGRAGA
jgi:hypothetical protein